LESVKQRQRQYWRVNLGLTASLLLIWAGVSFAPVYFAEPLNQITFFGWPLPFYMAAQGALLCYLLIVWVYAQKMAALDQAINHPKAPQ
jgi:putative solute:sodium symporter small subunit